MAAGYKGAILPQAGNTAVVEWRASLEWKTQFISVRCRI